MGAVVLQERERVMVMTRGKVGGGDEGALNAD